MKESAVERRLSAQVRSLGGLSIKLMPTVAGVPDRLILMPGGRVYLVELKAPRGRLRPIQQVWHERASAIGHPVYVVIGTHGVDTFVEKLKGELGG